MPKRPTLRTLQAEKKLLSLLGTKRKGSTEPLPSVRELGEQLGLSFATVSRLLQRFVQEGRAWQHPNGRYFPVKAGPQAGVALPIIVLGRQIQHWSRLYQEIIEGVSEVCTARGCLLIFLSSDKLVHHESPELPPTFGELETQATELERLVPAIPRLCGGLLLDHLWEEKVIMAHPFPTAPRLLLARQSRRGDLLSIAPDFSAGAGLILGHLAQGGCKQIYLAIPFSGDPAVDAAGDALCLAAANGADTCTKVQRVDCSTPAKRRQAISRLARLKTKTGLVCTEDNVATLLWQELHESKKQNTQNITLVSMQGTGAIDRPFARLRFDYRQLGRDAVTAVIERRRSDQLVSPSLIVQEPAEQHR